MSRVIAFRLNDNDPDEAQALALIDHLLGHGRTQREIMVSALLNAGGMERQAHHEDTTAADLRAALDEARQLVESLRTVGSVQPGPQVAQDGARPVSDAFRASVRGAHRPG